MRHRFFFALLAFFALIIGLYPGLYFVIDREFGLLSTKDDALLLDIAWNIGFYLHIVFGGLAMLVGIGLIGGVSQWLVIHAFRQAPPSSLSPFAYIGLVLALVWGWLVWGEVPTLWLLSGAAIVVSAGLYILHREITLGRARRRLEAAGP